MGVYLNPGNEGFRKAVSSKIYVDKTMLIKYTNECLNTEQEFICISRPRRFGKSITANMLAAGTKISFVFIIDEWDSIFREKKEQQEEQRRYLDFLRLLLKDQTYVALAYMTGILPIKK